MLEITIDDLTAHSFDEIVARLPPMTSGVNEAALNEQFRLIREALQRPVSFERRKYGRIPLPLLLRVTPLDQTGQRDEELAMTVVGKDISPRGISFFHERPLPYRGAIVTFDHPEIGRFEMEADIGWCQFTGVGWYVSGGRLTRSVSDRGVLGLADYTADDFDV